MQLSIDIVIPSFRLTEDYMLPILKLQRPENVVIKFYVLCDNPDAKPSPPLRSLVDNQNIFLIVNEKNCGAAATRNKGIEAGCGDWILFLDDDIIAEENLLRVYANAAHQYPDEIGFIGMVQLPEPKSAFTKAVKVSGSMDIFSIAERKTSYAWGATANIMVKRSAVGNTRFSSAYPKSGGGEDIDFFLNIREENGFKNYKTLRQAIVKHPWWNNEKINFTRPFRYGMGNSWLAELNPKYAYRDFFNTPETILAAIFLILLSIAFNKEYAVPLLLFNGGVFIIEMVASFVQAVKRKAEVNGSIYLYVMLLRMSYQTGLLWGNLKRWRLEGITERFNDNGSLDKTHFFRFNSYKITKWILYPVLIHFIFKKYF